MNYEDKKMKHKLIGAAILISVALSLSSCATKEYQAERAQCSAKYLQQIPAEMQTIQTTCYKSESYDTGKTQCTTKYYQFYSRQICEPIYENRNVAYPCTKVVDVNESYRNTQIKSCTEQQCLKKFGNTECASKKR